MELRNQIAQSGVHVDVDAPKGQDLAQLMAEIRAKYEKMALKNQEELKAWHESQVKDWQLTICICTEGGVNRAQSHLFIPIITSDNRSADPGIPEHRGPEGSPDRSERAAATDPDPGDRSGVTEEPGEKHSVSTHFIYPNTRLSELSAMPNSALSLQVSHIYFVDTSFTLWWPFAMELSSASPVHCKNFNPFYSFLLAHRKPPWRARWGTQRCVITWRWRLSTTSSWVWRRSSHNCVTTSRCRRRITRPCSTQRWSWRPRSLHTDGSWTVKTSSEYNNDHLITENIAFESLTQKPTCRMKDHC